MKKRKKRLVIVAVLIVLIGIGGWYLFLGGRIKDAVASATPNSNQAMEGSDTEAAAKMIQELTGADLFQIRTKRYYRSSFAGTAATAWIEETLNLRPGLAAQPENLDDYDVIYVGYPIWWEDMPMPVYSFLEECDFGAKTIIPFITHGGSGASRTVDTISELQPEALLMGNELVLSRNDVAESEETVVEWAQGLGVNNEDKLPEGTEVKGAVLICAGGAFQFRSDENEGTPVAEELANRGYQSFVVNYRLRPYTQEEGALDLARAVRFVRRNADVYGIDENDIAVMGFSAGGILAGEMLLNFDGTVNGTALDENYVPDELDSVSADAGADGMIYSFYGRLSVTSADVEKFASSGLPPTYFCYGTRDPFVSEFEKCVEALDQADVPVTVNVLESRPHGYGYREGWIPDYDEWLTGIFNNN